MKLLILGGTHEAQVLALKLTKNKLPIIYSLSYSKSFLPTQINTHGLEIHRGGFAQWSENCVENNQRSLNGLLKFISVHHVIAVLDMTHEYAYKISRTAQEACQQHNIPYWRYSRPAWTFTDKDDWIEVSNKDELFIALNEYQRPFFTVGSTALQWLDKKKKCQHWVIRSLQRDSTLKLKDITLLESPPLQDVKHEIDLMKAHKVDCLISKNSGSGKSFAKIRAARYLHLPVIMLKRAKADIKAPLDMNQSFISLESCYLHCNQWFENRGIFYNDR